MTAPASPTAAAEAFARPIEREEIAARLRDASLTVLDVLPRESYRSAHIPGAISLPADDVPLRARQLLPAAAQEIAVYCAAAT